MTFLLIYWATFGLVWAVREQKPWWSIPIFMVLGLSLMVGFIIVEQRKIA